MARSIYMRRGRLDGRVASRKMLHNTSHHTSLLAGRGRALAVPPSSLECGEPSGAHHRPGSVRRATTPRRASSGTSSGRVSSGGTWLYKVAPASLLSTRTHSCFAPPFGPPAADCAPSMTFDCTHRRVRPDFALPAVCSVGAKLLSLYRTICLALLALAAPRGRGDSIAKRCDGESTAVQ